MILGALPIGERTLLHHIEKIGIELTKTNGTAVEEMASKFVSAMEQEHKSVYYKHNWLVFVGCRFEHSHACCCSFLCIIYVWRIYSPIITHYCCEFYYCQKIAISLGKGQSPLN